MDEVKEVDGITQKNMTKLNMTILKKHVKIELQKYIRI